LAGHLIQSGLVRIVTDIPWMMIMVTVVPAEGRVSFDDLIALVGLVLLVAGVYLWIGLPAALIVLGAILIFIGVRVDFAALRGGKINEPGQESISK
jgi:uncharacterized membrane protein